MRTRTILAFSLLALSCTWVRAERVRFNLSFDGLFDNREYKNDMLPQTIYGVRLAPEIGITAGRHGLYGGLSGIWEFGADEQKNPAPILYYDYRGRRFETLFGFIPRRLLQRQLPSAFLDDSISFFDPTIQGTAIQYYGHGLQAEVYCNWFSRQSETRREAFRIVTDGQLSAGIFKTGWYAAMTHFAKPKEPGHFIYEKFQYYPYIGIEKEKLFSEDISISAHAGLLGSLTRCRKDGKWHNPMGLNADVAAGWKWLSLESNFYKGDALMPFLNDPEAGMTFHRGDRFYNHTFYNKTGMEIRFIEDKFVTVSFRWNMHITPDTPIHNQQLITVRYCYDPDKVNRKR